MHLSVDFTRYLFGRKRTGIGFLAVLASLVALTVLGFAGPAFGQSGGVADDETPTVERAYEGRPEALMEVTFIIDETVDVDVVAIIGLGDGEPLGYVSPTHPTDVSNTFGAWQRSITFTVVANDNFRYLYYRVGPHVEANGVELWDDQLQPTLERLELDEPGSDPIGFTLEYNFLPVVPPTPGSYAETCTVNAGRTHLVTGVLEPSIISWPLATDAMSPELWYDGEPYATGLDAASGEFTLTTDYYRKFGADSGIDLVTIITTGDEVRRVAVACVAGNGNWFWSVGFAPTCRVDLTTGWFTAHAPGEARLELRQAVGNRNATELLTRIEPWRSAAPTGVERTDAPGFGSLYRLRLDDAFFDRVGALKVRSGTAVWIRSSGRNRLCNLVLNDVAHAGQAVLRTAMSSRTNLAEARGHLVNPRRSVHLLELLRWELSQQRPYVAVSTIAGPSSFGYRSWGYNAIPRVVESDGRQAIPTASLCTQVTKLLDRGGSDQIACGSAEATAELCVAFRLTSGVCRSEVLPKHRAIVRTLNGLLNGNAATFIRGDQRIRQRPDSLEVELVSIQRSGTNAQVTVVGPDGTTEVLRAKRIPSGSWKFTAASVDGHVGFVLR